MKRLISALIVALLAVGPVWASTPGIPGGAVMVHVAGVDHDMTDSDYHSDATGMTEDCPMGDPGVCCGVAGGHCASNPPPSVAHGHPTVTSSKAILPKDALMRSGAHAEADPPPPRA